ncbi:hypothetical protein [Streptomyces fuscichromogenes]|uniref:Uncharacterized protein n=1 Tax=Streptomyces fuscichromogenes TaxID=1324013 RepID=A0A918CX07_9ACTN|nr:hypothetical protein [Streptomyces fuscichromogenes]GGN40908.1 hypothetical protein GCM10011578_088630 [Streptomyces fuscichromogenes]
MTMLVITPGLLLIVMVAGAVGFGVYQNSKKNSTRLPATGDLGAAIGAAVVVAGLLVALGWAAVPPSTVGPATGGGVPTCSSSSTAGGC